MGKKRFQLYVKLVLLVMTLFILGAFIFQSGEKKTEKGSFSEDYVLKEEIPEMLSFTYYTKEEWSQRLLHKLHDKITKEDIETILQELNVMDYISYSITGNKRVTREEWNTMPESLKMELGIRFLTYRMLHR